jgi:putative hydrolase of the HAD superfamily
VVRACLVDVYDTILTADFGARVRVLADLLGVDPARWAREWLRTRDVRGRGELPIADAFAVTMRALGVEPEPGLVGELVRTDAELLRDGSRLYDDTLAFFAALKARGIVSALVSNCSEGTRQMLGHLGMLAVADSVILSYEVGALKPSAAIYDRALADLGVAPGDAVMIDDQASFCAGAEAVGVRAIQIDRAARRDLADPAGPVGPDGLNGPDGPDGFADPPREPPVPVISSLLDAIPLL